MRIGMFINYYIPSKGGMETSVINLSKGLQEAGHEVFIFAPNYPNWVEKEKNVFRYKSFNFTYDGYQYVIPLPFMTKMEDTVRSLNLDVIHSHQPFSLGEEALKFGRKFDIPVVMTYHIRYEDYYHYLILVPKKIAQGFIGWVVNRYCKKCDAIIAPSSAIRNILVENNIKRMVSVIPSGIDINNFARDDGRRAEIRGKYGIKDNEVVMITASRVVKEKNIGFLVRALEIIRKTNQNAKLMIIGEGGEREALESLAKELNVEGDVIFTGLLDKDDMMGHYEAGDIFVFASLTETQGLVAVEAMASGLPVVAIKASGIEDMVKSGQDGILTDNDPQNFAENALKLIEDSELRKKMAEQAKINANAFSIEPWIQRVVALYKELITKKQSQ
jgi:1,2-diacylglycerol 3-alpha-glucosyltransferase